jgi:hypothetical protein
MRVVAAHGLAIGPGIGQRMVAFASACEEGSIAVHTADVRTAGRRASAVVEGSMRVRRIAKEPYSVVGRANVRMESSLESLDDDHTEHNVPGMAREAVGLASAADIAGSDVVDQAADVPIVEHTLIQTSRNAGSGRRSMIGASPLDEDQVAREGSLLQSHRSPWAT